MDSYEHQDLGFQLRVRRDVLDELREHYHQQPRGRRHRLGIEESVDLNVRLQQSTNQLQAFRQRFIDEWTPYE